MHGVDTTINSVQTMRVQFYLSLVQGSPMHPFQFDSFNDHITCYHQKKASLNSDRKIDMPLSGCHFETNNLMPRTIGNGEQSIRKLGKIHIYSLSAMTPSGVLLLGILQ